MFLFLFQSSGHERPVLRPMKFLQNYSSNTSQISPTNSARYTQNGSNPSPNSSGRFLIGEGNTKLRYRFPLA